MNLSSEMRRVMEMKWRGGKKASASAGGNGYGDVVWKEQPVVHIVIVWLIVNYEGNACAFSSDVETRDWNFEEGSTIQERPMHTTRPWPLWCLKHPIVGCTSLVVNMGKSVWWWRHADSSSRALKDIHHRRCLWITLSHSWNPESKQKKNRGGRKQIERKKLHCIRNNPN